MTDKEIFDSLCRNALDFLNRALDDLEARPKSALIHFAAAVELVFKARLVLIGSMWVAEEPTEATAERFAQGRLRTVGLELAKQRIETLGGGAIDPEAFKIFRAVARHRNRVVHFFHSGMDSAQQREAIAAEIYVAWYYLYRLLSELWLKQFAAFQRDISEFGVRLQGLRPFLDAVFKKVVKGNPKASGFSNCQICSYKAVDSATGDRYAAAVCRVCGVTTPSHKAIQHGEEDFVASCMSCGAYQSARVTTFGLRCGECGETFSESSTCEYCNEHWVGVSEDYGDFYTGCEYCEGAAGRHSREE